MKLAARGYQIDPHRCFASASFFSCRHKTRTNTVLRPLNKIYHRTSRGEVSQGYTSSKCLQPVGGVSAINKYTYMPRAHKNGRLEEERVTT